MFFSHNFGHNGPNDFHGLGINGKISELQAAMGLAVLPHIDKIIHTRKKIVEHYDNTLDFNNLNKIKIRENTLWNYSYYPLIFNSEGTLFKVQKALNDKTIFPRRYFFPSLNNLNYVDSLPMKISENIASRVLCLPLYVDLGLDELETIINIINENVC